jgi:7-cyano-7-deazaguanine reductase
VNDKELLLGRQTPVVEEYAPQLLYPILRSEGRANLGMSGEVAFDGVDLWHAYEMSWLDSTGKPEVRVGRFVIPADSPNMIESKSFKLYLNSLNNVRYKTEQDVVEVLRADIGGVAGAEVELQLFSPDDSRLAGHALPGTCIDDQALTASGGQPDASMLQRRPATTDQQLHTHLLRSLCPVTGQPDWASVYVHCQGCSIEPASLLSYIVAYRVHQEYHEQCVERMFVDIQQRIQPDFLKIQAFYTRRGGMDINPMRCSDPGAQPLSRMNRQ